MTSFAVTAGDMIADLRMVFLDQLSGLGQLTDGIGLSSDHRNIPEYLVGAVEDIAKMIGEFVPIARVLIGVEIEENSELDLLDWAKAHRGNRKYVAFANKYWPAFPVACEVDI